MPELKVGDTIVLSAQPVLADGSPSQAESLVWSTSDEAIVSLVGVDEKGAAEFKAESVGTVELVAEADADMGEGESKIRSGIKVVVSEPQANSLEIRVVSISPKEPPYEIKKRDNEGGK